MDKLSSNVSGARALNVDPDSGEESTGGEHEQGVDYGVDWVLLDVVEALWRADVVGQATDWVLVTSHVVVLPLAKQADQEVASESLSQDLGEEVDVAHKGGLQDDWDVRGVEQFDGEWLLQASLLSG